MAILAPGSLAVLTLTLRGKSPKIAPSRAGETIPAESAPTGSRNGVIIMEQCPFTTPSGVTFVDKYIDDSGSWVACHSGRSVYVFHVYSPRPSNPPARQSFVRRDKGIEVDTVLAAATSAELEIIGECDEYAVETYERLAERVLVS